MKKRLILLVLLMFVQQAWAQTDSCAFRAHSGVLVEFERFAAGLMPTDGTGIVPINCVPGLAMGAVSYSVSISEGASGSFSPREMIRAGGTARLQYDLYIDPSRLLIWGDGTLGTSVAIGTCSGDCDVMTYGRLLGGQYVPSGSYADDVTVTVNF